MNTSINSNLIFTASMLTEFRRYLLEEEKSQNTVEKYLRDVRAFSLYAQGEPITHELVLEYKAFLLDEEYAPRSINSMLASLNSFFQFTGWDHLRVKNLKIQKQLFCAAEEELTVEEHKRLVATAEEQGKESISLIMQTLCSTGIRIGELPFITVESARLGKAVVSLKGKTRVIFFVKGLQDKLLDYTRRNGITEGCIFLNSKGQPVDRSLVWARMKALCEDAGIPPEKVSPHALRRLFAKQFYELEKDIVKLADVLGHSSIETTRIYIVSSGDEHRKKMEQMDLLY